jgi:hypothetical protein
MPPQYERSVTTNMRIYTVTRTRAGARSYSAFGAYCPSVASLAWSLAVAGMPGSAGGVFRVLAGVSGIGGERFSWMGGGSSAVTGLLLI